MAPAALKRLEGFEPRFYSKDRGEKPHVHLVRGSGRRGGKTKIKFWLGPPVTVDHVPRNLKDQEVRHARRIVEDHWHEIHQAWTDFFTKDAASVSGGAARNPGRAR